MVVRAYSWHAFVPGIIVDEESELVQEWVDGGSYSYESDNFMVAWSDGTMSTEMGVELDHYVEGVVSESR